MSTKKSERNLQLWDQAFNEPPMRVDKKTIPFPAKPAHTRVIISRPAPEPIQPVRRTCPTCRAVFDDYSGQPTTVYCSESCAVRMSQIKRATGEALLADLRSWPEQLAADVLKQMRLAQIEADLNDLGYFWNRERKEWRKR